MFGWLPVLAWGAVLLYLGSLRAIPLPEGDLIRLVFGKAIHVGEYAILAFLFYRAIPYGARAFSLRRAAVVFFITLVFAGLDEWRQTFISMRYGNIADVGIDAVGAGFGLLVTWIRSRDQDNVGELKIRS